ncbi:TetR/AcrR family transcriptional regulator [Novosphingobium sp.]|uniref:TetR/AcrR family transcriptional regulator n=1 Tax=Novosphingobium sp. TaxID=1874826 RepID=UPI0031CFDA7C
MDLDQSGRARQHRFDVEDVLSKALAMFLELGFLGSSISQLTEAMGIARPSLYQAFGNKEGLFRAAMKLHHHRRLNCVLSALKKPQFPLVIEHLIKATQQKSPISTSCSPLSEFALGGPPAIMREAFAREQNIHGVISQRVAKAQMDGEIDRSINPDALAASLVAINDSIALRIRAGGTPEEVALLVEASKSLTSCTKQRADAL